MKTFDRELVSGNILRSVWKLAWPTVLLNLVNGLHGFIDQVLVGNFYPREANGAIGIAWQLFLVVLVVLVSFYHGMNVLVARYAGKQDRERLSEVVYHVLLATGIFMVAIVGPLGYVCSPFLLTIPRATPEEVAYALPYLRILFTCSAPLFLMFLLTGAMQASGTPKTPLVLGVLTTVLNIAFSAVLIPGLGPFPRLGPSGAAIATCLAPIPSVVIALRLILKGQLIIHPLKHYPILPDGSVLKAVVRIGLPTGIQAIVLNAGGVMLLRYIGSLDQPVDVRAAYVVCYTQLFSLITWSSWGLRNAASTLMGQNIGAGDPGRGSRAVNVATGFGLSWAMAIGALYLFVPEQLLALFGRNDEPVLSYGIACLRYLALSGLFLTASLSFTGGLIGSGNTMSTMVIAIISQIGVLLGVCQLYAFLGRLSADTIWFAILLSHTSRLLMTYPTFRLSKWRPTRAELEE